MSKIPNFRDPKATKLEGPLTEAKQGPRFSLEPKNGEGAKKWVEDFEKQFIDPPRSQSRPGKGLNSKQNISTEPVKDFIKHHGQKIILLLTAFILALMLLFPPFHKGKSNWGYSFILSPPYGGRATINSEALITQCLIVTAIGIICWFAFREKK